MNVLSYIIANARNRGLNCAIVPIYVCCVLLYAAVSTAFIA